jgi:methyl-accepting chemotaxis protein
MSRINRKHLTVRLACLTTLSAIIPIALVGYLADRAAEGALKRSTFNMLESNVELRANAVMAMLHSHIADVVLLASVHDTEEAFDALTAYHDASGATADGGYDVESAEYAKVFREVGTLIGPFASNRGHDEVHLICAAHGHVMYSSVKHEDMGTNLRTGKYRDSSLAQLYRKIVETAKPRFQDFALYAPSGEPEAFIGAPVVGKEDGGLRGIVVLELPQDALNEILTQGSGLGKTGETYAVGSDMLMRSDSRFSDASTVLEQKVDTAAIRRALGLEGGEHGITETDIITGYRGMSVLSCYRQLGLDEDELLNTDTEWVVSGEIEEAEAFATARGLRRSVSLWAIAVAGLAGAAGLLVARRISTPLLEGVNVLASSATEISATVSQIASTAQQTAAAVSETSTTVSEVRQTAEVASDKAMAVSESAKRAEEASQQGKSATARNLEGMGRIEEQMAAITASIMQLSEQGQTIGDIITTVSDLAEQSNLLAVNAAIEAAKAGDQGKGFSVVAQEIRSLAEQSKEATTRVRTILGDIQRGTSSAVLTTEQGAKAVSEGKEQAESAGRALALLAEAVEDAANAATQIAASSQQQSVGMEQVSSAMESIKQASGQSQDSTKQLAGAAHDLQELGEKLRDLVGVSATGRRG